MDRDGRRRESPRQRDEGYDGYARTSGFGCVRAQAIGRLGALDELNEMRLTGLTHWIGWTRIA